MDKHTTRQRGWQRAALLGCLLVLSLLAAYGSTQLAQAADTDSPPPNSAVWLVDVHFPGTTISATLFITAEVGINTYTRTVDLSPTCMPQAGAVISMNQAIMGRPATFSARCPTCPRKWPI